MRCCVLLPAINPLLTPATATARPRPTRASPVGFSHPWPLCTLPCVPSFPTHMARKAPLPAEELIARPQLLALATPVPPTRGEGFLLSRDTASTADVVGSAHAANALPPVLNPPWVWLSLPALSVHLLVEVVLCTATPHDPLVLDQAHGRDLSKLVVGLLAFG
jgi:hypothetical protein